MAEYTYPSIPSKLLPNDIVHFSYTGSVITWNPRNNGVSKIKVECWGASGADCLSDSISSNATRGGKGGYTSGYISNLNTPIFLSVGSRGNLAATSVQASRVFGGGGTHGGGGCTWIAKQNNPTNKSHLYTVAGGGGSASSSYQGVEHGGHGGGLNGGTSTGPNPLPGGGQNGINSNSTTSNTNDGAGFLLGGNSNNYWSTDKGGGGGAGLYGGRGSKAYNSNQWTSPGGGGSSYIEGIEEAATYDGSTSYGNTGNGRIKITILENSTQITITTIDKKPVYRSPEPVKFTVNSNKNIAKISVIYEEQTIESFANPVIDDSVEYTVEISHELFLNTMNGTNYVRWVCYDSAGMELHTHVEKYNKYSNNMTIITEPIQIKGPELAVDFNINLLTIDSRENIKIFVCNNGYDESPTWEDMTSRLLNDLNVLLTNKTKVNENWGLSFKIEANGPFELDEQFIGGFYVHGVDNSTTLSPEQSEPNVYRNTPWGEHLHKQSSIEAEKEILLMELNESIYTLSDNEKGINHYKDLYEKGFISEKQYNRIVNLNK